MVINQHHFKRILMRDAGITKIEADLCIRAMADEVRSQMAEGNDVYLFGIGRLKVTMRKARVGRNNMGEVKGVPVHIPARKTIKFSPRASLLDAVRGE